MSDLAMLRRDDGVQRIEQDEEGHLRLVAEHGAKIKYCVGLAVPQTTRRALTENPACAHCGETIGAAKDAALVIMPDRSHRVAHRGQCFVLALIATHPSHFTSNTASSRATTDTQSRAQTFSNGSEE